ncbi:MAG: Rrf2 family transcriptional regulator [Neisseriaceae bacterium]
MKLTTKGRNAVTAMLDVCLYANNRPVSLAAIHERQGVSVHYLEQLFLKMRRAGLVKSVRGPGGGYQLSRDASSIKIADIIYAVEDNFQITLCGGHVNCRQGSQCIGHGLWCRMEQVLEDFLANLSLYDAVCISKQDSYVVPREKLPIKLNQEY